ncbi:MAG: hypothetical protein PW792_11855 [Acidobacteriaceae bacterium]|nr:hypothetical protein [Acidobacteriaceae bacterium]
MKTLVTTSLLLAASLSLAGCKSDKATKQAESVDKSATPVAAAAVIPADAGEISGVVNFTGKAPAPVAIDMSMDPACAMSGGTNTSEQYVVNAGKLANVYVYVKGVTPSVAPAGQAPVVLDQKGCKYTFRM